MREHEARPLAATGGRAQAPTERPLSHSTPVYIPDGAPAYAGTRRVGTWRRDAAGCLWLRKAGLVPTKHMVRFPTPGWATEVEHIESLERDANPGGVRLECLDGETWRASLATLQRFGESLERGWGEQWFLHRHYWQREPAGVHQPGLFDLEPVP